MTTSRTSLRNRAVAVSAAVLLGGAAIAVPAFAQDATDDATTEDGGSSADDELDDAQERRQAAREEARAAREEVREAREDVFVERLAAELGLDVDTVDEAVTTVKDELKEERRAEMLAELETRLAERVEAGDLTQEEADEILASAEAGELRGGFGRRGFGHRGHGGFGGFGGSSDDVPADEATTDEA